MLNQTSIKLLQNSLSKTATVGIVVEIVHTYILERKKAAFDDNWLKRTLATMIGFTVHGLLTYRLNNLIKFKNPSHVAAAKDVIFFGTMLFVKEVVLSFIYDTTLNIFSFYQISLILVGYTIYNLYIIKNQPKLEKGSKWTNSFNDSIKSVSAILISDFLPDQDIEYQTLPVLFDLLVALPVYHMLVKPRILK